MEKCDNFQTCDKVTKTKSNKIFTAEQTFH